MTSHSQKMGRSPLPAKVPAAKRSESPGRNGVTTSPVSQKSTMKMKRSVHV